MRGRGVSHLQSAFISSPVHVSNNCLQVGMSSVRDSSTASSPPPWARTCLTWVSIARPAGSAAQSMVYVHVSCLYEVYPTRATDRERRHLRRSPHDRGGLSAYAPYLKRA